MWSGLPSAIGGERAEAALLWTAASDCTLEGVLLSSHSELIPSASLLLSRQADSTAPRWHSRVGPKPIVTGSTAPKIVVLTSCRKVCTPSCCHKQGRWSPSALPCMVGALTQKKCSVSLGHDGWAIPAAVTQRHVRLSLSPRWSPQMPGLSFSAVTLPLGAVVLTQDRTRPPSTQHEVSTAPTNRPSSSKVLGPR